MRTSANIALAVGFAVIRRTCGFFVAPAGTLHRINGSTGRLSSSSTDNLPSLEELSKDPFMKQVSHASELVPRLNDITAQEELSNRLKAQLSHSDGIRGFFVTYLTGEGKTPADGETIPTPLAQAMEEANQEELIPLACMNVVMPTAMVTMHTDSGLSASSAKTAVRGKRILSALQGNPEAAKNCLAIRAAAGMERGDVDADLVAYWERFFDNYGYKEQQLEDIARAVSDL